MNRGAEMPIPTLGPPRFGPRVRRHEPDWHDHIEVDPQILHGKPCIKGTRIPVALILGYVAAGESTEDILREYPDITAEDVVACLKYARDLADFEAVAGV
ncbi:MAG TPA: DUF433 domain-containing protein [Gammaproteobacteria bacterium]|jgi:uncharacterized protein (DUF433 family)